MAKQFKCKFINVSDDMLAEFKSSTCLLTISVGQETHEDQRLAATVGLVNDVFDSCVITVHDTLQRYTMALNKEEHHDFFHDYLVKEGDQWLARNDCIFKEGSSTKKIIRWSDWMSHPDFLKQKDMVLAEMSEDLSYKNIFDDTIDEYLSRFCRRLSTPNNFNRERAYQLCLDYLVEECAVLCLWPQTGCHFELYAGKHNLAITETRKRFINAQHPNLVRPIMLSFNHRPDLQPQNFKTYQIDANNDLRIEKRA